MEHGFYVELDELKQEDPEASFGFLEHTIIGNKNAFQYLHGFCDEFAAALSDVYGYEIVTVRHCEEDDVERKLIHAYCIAEIDGETALIDIRGATTDPELFFEEFENEVTYDPRDEALWDLDGPVVVETWKDKAALFDGEYAGWDDEGLRTFILENGSYYNLSSLEKSLARRMAKADVRRMDRPVCSYSEKKGSEPDFS